VKVLYIVTAFPRNPADLITPWLTETIHRLGSHGVEVEVLAPAYRGLPGGRWNGIPVHRFRYAPAPWETLTHDQTAPDRVRQRPWFAGLVPGYVAGGSLAAARLARTGRFAAVHAFWPIPHGVLGIAAKKAGRIPLVSTFFGVELTWLESDLAPLRPVLKWIVRNSDAVTAISSYTAARLRSATGSSVTPDIVPFSATVEPRSAEPAGSSSSGAFEVLFVGRLVERKGVDVLLRATAKLRADRALRVRIVGDGPERGQLQALRDELELQDVVEFTGAISNEALARRFAECSAFVLPAVVDSKGDTEGLGVVLIEAMQNTRPVIGSDAGGIPDIVRHEETGLLVPSGDVAALAAAIRRLIDEPALAAKLAEQGRRYVEDAFSWNTIVDRLTAIYRRVERTGDPREVDAPGVR
jgi:glycosyltransferase involved in cell wall biosynthesis